MYSSHFSRAISVREKDLFENLFAGKGKVSPIGRLGFASYLARTHMNLSELSIMNSPAIANISAKDYMNGMRSVLRSLNNPFAFGFSHAKATFALIGRDINKELDGPAIWAGRFNPELLVDSEESAGMTSVAGLLDGPLARVAASVLLGHDLMEGNESIVGYNF
jgi:hypothetical protein